MCPRESLSNTHFAYMFLSQCLGAVLEKPFSFYVTAAGVPRCIFFWINLCWRLWPSLLCGLCRVAVSRAALWLWQGLLPGLAGCSAQTQKSWHVGQLPRGTWNRPRPGIEPVSPALAGGLLSTLPLGKSMCVHLE